MTKYAGGALIPTLSIDRKDSATITVQLVTALRELILSGQLRAGERLPASRTLAQDQAVSRTTAINAYEQLTAEGLIHSQVGSGTYVSDTVPIPAPTPPEPREDLPMPRLANLSSSASDHAETGVPSHPGRNSSQTCAQAGAGRRRAAISPPRTDPILRPLRAGLRPGPRPAVPRGCGCR